MKTVGKRKPPRTPEEFHALGANLDREAQALDADQPRGFVVKFRTWDDLERWENNRLMERARRMRAG
jgi:hypothetical protein